MIGYGIKEDLAGGLMELCLAEMFIWRKWENKMLDNVVPRFTYNSVHSFY